MYIPTTVQSIKQAESLSVVARPEHMLDWNAKGVGDV